MKITQEHVGKKVRLKEWGVGTYVEVISIGNELFFFRDYLGNEGSRFLDNDWELYEKPKKKILSPCVWKNDFNGLDVGPEIFETERDAKDWAKLDFISWPAMQLINGKEVPIQIVVEE